MKVYSDSLMMSPKKMSRYLFMENARNPKNTMHYTGNYMILNLIVQSISLDIARGDKIAGFQSNYCILRLRHKSSSCTS